MAKFIDLPLTMLYSPDVGITSGILEHSDKPMDCGLMSESVFTF